MAGTLLETFFVDIVFKGDRRELDKWDRGIKNLNQRLNNLVRPFTIAGTVGAASLGLIGKAGLDTEKALLRLRAELGLTEDQMRALREEALRVGSDLPLNTADIVNAQRAYGKLGATFAEIIRDAPAIAGAAVATDLQPEQVARYARIVQNVFGGDPQENLDIMVRLATRSQGDFLAFGEALQFSGQAAADAGLDFKTYISVLGGLAGSGRSVESVSQGLQAIWAKLAKSGEGIGRGGKIVQEAFEGVGISMTDVNATMDGTADSFVRLLELINNAGLSPTQRTALLSTLADVTYASAVSSAVQNTEKIRDLLAEAALAPGEISRQQEAVLSGASGGITIMMAQIDTLLNRLAEFGTLTGIQHFANAISGLVGWLTRMNEEGELVNRRFLQLISIGVTALASMLAVAAALKVTTFALSGFVVLVKLARGAVSLWRNALLLTRIQMGLLSIQTWWANSALRMFATAIWTRVSPGLTALWGRVTAAAGAMLRFATTIWSSSVAALRTLATRLALAGAAMLRFSGRAVAAGIAGVVAFAASIWTGAVPALAAFAAGVWAVTIAMLANPVGLIVLAIAGLVAGLAVLIWKVDTVRNAFKAMWSFIRNNWQEVAGLLLLPILGPFALIATNAFGLRDKLMGVFSAIKDFFVGVWDSVVGIFRDHWAKILAIIFPPAGLPILIAKNWGRIVEIVGGIWSRVNDTVRGWIEAIIAFIEELPARVLGVVKDIPDMVVDAIRDIPGLGVALDVVAGAASKVKGLVPGFAQGGVVPGPLGRPVLSLVHGGEMVIPPGALDTLSQMLNGFAAGPAALPTAPAGAAAMYRSSVSTRTTKIEITGPIVIHTQATDSREIAQHLAQEIEDQVRNIAYDQDGPIDR